jgi:RHS repeat-associated protein
MKAWRGLFGVTVFAFGVAAVCAQTPVLSNIEAPYAALQTSATIAGTQWGPGMVAYGPAGTPLVLTGSALGGSGTVQFVAYKNGIKDTNVNPVQAAATMWSANMLILTVPTGAYSGLVTVTTDDNKTSNGLPFLVTPGAYAGTCPAGPTTTQLQITTASLHDGLVGQAYSATLGATGGTTAYTWSITSGTLPSGLTLTASTGTISGTPTAVAGPVDVTFQVTDSSTPLKTDEAVLSLNIESQTLTSNVAVYSYTVPNSTCTSSNPGYDCTGNLKQYQDTIMGNWSFNYDTLNRLIAGTPSSGDFSGGNNYCWAYDSFGNRTAQVIQTAACPTPPAAPAGAITYTNKNQVPNTVTGASAVGYDPLGSGNVVSAVTSIGQTYYSYDAEGRICAVQSTPMPGMSAAYGYLYDADGTRVAKGSITPVSNPATQSLSCDPTTNGFQFTENYVLGPSGEELTMFGVASGTTTWQRTNVYTAGKLLATYDTMGLHFHLTDPLGSRRMQLSGTLATMGCPETDIQSLPFGDQLNPYTDPNACPTADDATPLHFTGKERDTESGNDYFGARYYASSMGRFMSPDPSQLYYADPTNPQSFNLYSYAVNNPLKFVDPSGLWHCVWNSATGDQDDKPEDGGASEGDCADQGGAWTIDDGDDPGDSSETLQMNSNHPGGGGSGGGSSDFGVLLHQIACSFPGVVGQIAQVTGHTVGFGLGGSAGAGIWSQGFAINLGVQIVADKHKNMGIAGTFGVTTPFSGFVVGAGADGGVQISGSNAKSISDLEGPAVDIGGSAGAGWGGGADVAFGLATNSQGHITGPSGVVTGTVTGPFAAGGKLGVSGMLTQTKLLASTNCSDVW